MKTCAEEFSGSESILSSYSDILKVEGIKDMAMHKDAITYSYTEVDYVERDSHGFWKKVSYYIFDTRYYTPKEKDKNKNPECKLRRKSSGSNAGSESRNRFNICG